MYYEFFSKLLHMLIMVKSKYLSKSNFTGIIIMDVTATPQMGAIEDSGSKLENLW